MTERGLVYAVLIAALLGLYWLVASALASPCCITATQISAPIDPRQHGMTCWTIKSYIWVYGEEAAIAWAKTNGYSDAQIFALKRRCKI